MVGKAKLKMNNDTNKLSTLELIINQTYQSNTLSDDVNKEYIRPIIEYLKPNSTRKARILELKEFSKNIKFDLEKKGFLFILKITLNILPYIPSVNFRLIDWDNIKSLSSLGVYVEKNFSNNSLKTIKKELGSITSKNIGIDRSVYNYNYLMKNAIKKLRNEIFKIEVSEDEKVQKIMSEIKKLDNEAIKKIILKLEYIVNVEIKTQDSRKEKKENVILNNNIEKVKKFKRRIVKVTDDIMDRKYSQAGSVGGGKKR